MDISEKIKLLRERKLRISQSELGELVHTSRQAVSAWERGDNPPGMDSMKLLVEVFDVSYNVLMDETIDLNDPKQWEIHVEKKAQEEQTKKPVEPVRQAIEQITQTKLSVPVYPIYCKMVTNAEKRRA